MIVTPSDLRYVNQQDIGGGTTSMIETVEEGTLVFSGSSSTTTTATVTSFDESRTMLEDLGQSVDTATANDQHRLLQRCSVTNDTTITGTRANGNTSSNSTGGFKLTQYADGLINSIQDGTITLGSGVTSATATISSISTSKYLLSNLGVTLSSGTTNESRHNVRITLTNPTTVTATRGSTGDTCIVGFMAGDCA